MPDADIQKLWVDPPSGWRFGFPKIWDKAKNPDFKLWLTSQGYPEQEYEKYNGNYIRYWEAHD